MSKVREKQRNRLEIINTATASLQNTPSYKQQQQWNKERNDPKNTGEQGDIPFIPRNSRADLLNTLLIYHLGPNPVQVPSPIPSTYKFLLSPPPQLCTANLPNQSPEPISTPADTMCTLEEQVFSGCNCSYRRYLHLHLPFLREPLHCPEFSRRQLKIEGPCGSCARKKRRDEFESCCLVM